MTGTDLPRAQGAPATRSRRRARGPEQTDLVPWVTAGGVLIAIIFALWLWRTDERARVAHEVAAAVAKEVTPPPPASDPSPPPSLPASLPPIPGPAGLEDGQSVVVSVRPAARFVQALSGQVLCETTATCRVPIDVDVRVELAGHQPRTLRGDDLYDRRGARWSVVMQPTVEERRKGR